MALRIIALLMLWTFSMNSTKSTMKRTAIILFLLAIVAAQGASCKKAAETPGMENFSIPANSSTTIEQKNAAINGSRQNAITTVARECSPAIVGINVTEMREMSVNPFGFDDPFFGDIFRRFNQRYTQPVRSLGSGFIVSSDGYIITNDHVAGRASKIVVTTTNGEKYDAEIIGSDPTSDVALLKINASNLPYLKLGNSDNVIVGEWSIAFGNPFGLFDKNSKPTVTVGVISNTGVSFSENSEGSERVYRNMLQTDAAISSGNSGGPLINANGEVIGMNTIIFSTAQSNRGSGSIGIGFAIPVNRVRQIMTKLKSGEKLERAFFTGLAVDFLTERTAALYRSKRQEGVIITRVVTNSPAEKAGLEPGDIILEIDKSVIHNDDDLKVAINDAVVGQVLEFKIERDGEQMTKKMTLEKRR